jgi:hypothetical protein
MTKTEDAGAILILFFLLTLIVLGIESCSDSRRRIEKETKEYYQQKGASQ